MVHQGHLRRTIFGIGDWRSRRLLFQKTKTLFLALRCAMWRQPELRCATVWTCRQARRSTIPLRPARSNITIKHKSLAFV